MASLSPEIQAAWRAGNPPGGVTFAFDDLVTLTAGEHTGNVGTLVAIEQLEPEVVYSVEIDTNFVVPARQSEIEMAD